MVALCDIGEVSTRHDEVLGAREDTIAGQGAGEARLTTSSEKLTRRVQDCLWDVEGKMNSWAV